MLCKELIENNNNNKGKSIRINEEKTYIKRKTCIYWLFFFLSCLIINTYRLGKKTNFFEIYFQIKSFI